MSAAPLTEKFERPPSGRLWLWLILLPVAASVVAGLTTLGIAIRYGDKPLPESVSRTGPVQYGENSGLIRARELEISGSARIDSASHAIHLTLRGRELPQQVLLRLWHPTESTLDQLLVLTRGDDGSYRGVWPAQSDGLALLLTAPDAGWELPGARNSTDTLSFVTD